MITNTAKAELILRRRREFADGTILEGVVWQLPESVEGSEHFYKYRLFYGYPGQRVIGYDNERGKGDHKHYHDVETSYSFSSPEQVWTNFISDVANERNTS